MLVNDALNSLYSGGIERFCHGKGALIPARVQQRSALVITNDHIAKRLRIAWAEHHCKPRCPRHCRRACPHAPCQPPRRRGGCDNWPHRLLRGKNKALRRRNRRPGELNFKERRDHHRPIRPKPCLKVRGKPLCPGARAREQKRGARGAKSGQGSLGLCDLALSVTCDKSHRQQTSMTHSLTFLGIESSCDDTAAAVVRWREGRAEVLASVVAGQTDLHAAFGGVVPEIAARAHAEKLDLCVEDALAQSGLDLQALDGIAVTSGPGLIGGVMAGVMCARGLAAGSGLPLIGVNHLAGHALTPRLTDSLPYPYLMLLVSGGHCQFLVVHGPERFTRLGGTIDDAPGEAFDKTAKILGLPQPGGPAVEQEAMAGDARAYALPRPLLDKPGCDMSFSGLKTALLRARDAEVARHGGLPRQARRDLCASFQSAVAAVLAEKTRRALALYLQEAPLSPALAVAGGVAANKAIRAALETVCGANGVRFTAPPLRLCTDNAAMIAYAGIERFVAGATNGTDLVARPRWPLDNSAPAMLGSGKKGAKA